MSFYARNNPLVPRSAWSNQHKSIAPKVTKGYVYYARLKKDGQTYYKLGFTTHSSVESRLSYKGTGDENYLDKVFLFAYDHSAFHLEQKIHEYFVSSRAFPYSSSTDLLYMNGQSEIYYADILSMDVDYQENDGIHTAEKYREHQAKYMLKIEDTEHAPAIQLFGDIYGYWLTLTYWPKKIVSQLNKRSREKTRKEFGITDIIETLKSNNQYC